MQNGFWRHARHDVNGLIKADEYRVRLNNALQRLLVGGGDFIRQRRVGDAIQRLDHLHIALARRRPVEQGDGGVLLFQIVAEHGDTDVNHVQRLVK